MASELSRLIEDELEKVERAPAKSEGRQELRSSLRIKMPKSSVLDAPPPTWRERAWWSWKRIGMASVVATLVCSVLYLALAPSPTSSSTAGYTLTDSQVNSALRPEEMFGDSKQAADDPYFEGEAAFQEATSAATAGALSTPSPPHHHTHLPPAPKHEHTPTHATTSPTLASGPAEVDYKAASLDVVDLSPMPGRAGPVVAPAGAKAAAGAPTFAAGAPEAGEPTQLAAASPVPQWSMQIGRRMLH